MLWQENELANIVKTWNDKPVQMAELFLPYIIFIFINILRILLISIYKYVTMLFVKENINKYNIGGDDVGKKIAAYMRISVDTEKDRDNTSIENQRRIIKAYLKQRFPDAKVDYYVDRDRSGYTFEQRESYMKMRPLLMSGDYDILLIKDLSRFSRRNSKGLVELEDLRDAGVRIISIGDGIDYPTYDDWNNIQVRFLLNEMPVTDASKKVKKVVEMRQNNADWICAVPYGYYMVDSKNMTFEVDEACAEVVRRIFEMYNSGMGYKKISNTLTDEKIPTPRMVEIERKRKMAELNKKKVDIKLKASPVWAIPTVSGILQNDFYIGTLRQRKYTRKRINGPDKRLNAEENIVFENHHTPIVSEREFMKAQQQLATRTKNNYRGNKKYDNDYSGFLFCGECGSPMFSMSRPDLAPAYTCGTYHKRGLKGCTSHHIRVDVLDTVLKKYVERIMKTSDKMIAELEKNISNEANDLKTNADSVADLQVDLARAKEEYKATQKQKIRDIMKADEEQRDMIEEAYEDIENELISKIEGLEKQTALMVERRNQTIEVNRIAKNAIEIFRDIVNKKKLDKGDLSIIIDKIIIHDGDESQIDIQLKSDIQMLLESGTLTEEELERAGYRGKVVNFKWDIESNLEATIVQKVRNQKDKAFGVNVLCGGDPLEIYTDSEGEVIFKKYSPIGELSGMAGEYAEVLHKGAGLPVVITDNDHVIAASGINKREVLERRVTKSLEELMTNRQIHIKTDKVPSMSAIEGYDRQAQVVYPIIYAGDVSGAVALFDGDSGELPSEADIKLVQVAASFLGKQME